MAEKSPSGADFLLAKEPENIRQVVEARSGSASGDPVAVVGRIGGSRTPWVESAVAFTLVDNSRKACSDIEGDACPTPWDYCCDSANLKEATAFVKLVDAAGKVVTGDAREVLGVKELSTVVVQGTAQRDEAGNLTILARGIFVRQ